MNEIIDDFEFQIKELEEILKGSGVREDPQFKEWLSKFKLIYGSKNATIKLYILNSIVYLLSLYFLNTYVLNKEEKIETPTKIQEQLQKRFKNLKLLDIEYFTPFLSIFDNGDHEFHTNLSTNFFDYMSKNKTEPEYFFDFFIQNLISPLIRHKAGEFYTPPFLVKKMVKEKYTIGEKVLDPCCGTGNFLIEIVKVIISSDVSTGEKVSALKGIYGFDINPLSIYITKINLLYLLKDLIHEGSVNLFELDSLFQTSNQFLNFFDLVIGNPPWYTYRDIELSESQEKIKALADELDIKPLPKNILNIEISSLFFYQARNLYMNKNAKIFFVITKGVITGSHAARFRNFNGFKNIKVWTFDKKIEKIFNIDFICLFAQKKRKDPSKFDLEIPVNHYTMNNEGNNIKYFSLVELELESKSILVPYSVELKANKKFTKKLIPKELKDEMLPNKKSYYKNLFHKGADLNPRNLIFLSTKEVDKDLVEINPDERIFKKAKEPWVRREFTDVIIEKDYVFKVVKSTELVKFGIFDYYNVFLPLSKDDLSFEYEKLTKNAKIFYDKINKIYLQKKKETTKNKSLMENLDRWGKLINDRQKSEIKVVYNNSGSILNSAVVQGDFLATGDLSFYDTNNLDEAHYLTSILNSPIMTKQIQIKKSSRHIFKLPFNSPIKKFNETNPNHQRLAELGKECEDIAKSIVDKNIKENGQFLSKYKIQKILKEGLDSILERINVIVKKELN
jgi:SAM-dependent methyltransferase